MEEKEEEEEEVPDKSSFAKEGAGKEEAEDEGGGGGKHEIIVSASSPALRSPEARPPWLAGSGLRGTPDGPSTSGYALLHLCFRLKYLPSKPPFPGCCCCCCPRRRRRRSHKTFQKRRAEMRLC